MDIAPRARRSALGDRRPPAVRGERRAPGARVHDDLHGEAGGGVAGGIVGGLPDAPAPPEPTRQVPVRVDFRKEEARPIRRVEPVYPDLAAQAHVQGIVILEVLVDERGVPSKSNVLRSVPLLDAAAIDAVEEWRWNPYVIGGRAVPFFVTVTVNFRLTTS